MEKNKAKMFNEKAASKEAQADAVINSLEIKPNSYIADIGSGGGFFALKFANIINETGKVFCVDNSLQLLNYIEKQKNPKLKTVLYDGKNLNLDDNSIDIFFMRNVTHHIKNRKVYFNKLKKVLKPDGIVAIIDYNKGSFFSFHGILGHFVEKKRIIKEMTSVGYSVKNSFDFLEKQHFTIFEL